MTSISFIDTAPDSNLVEKAAELGGESCCCNNEAFSTNCQLHLKDVCDRKILHTEFFLKFNILLFKLYLIENR